MTIQQPVSYEDYMKLSDAYDKYSRTLMSLKGEEYSTGNDFLEMENRLAGMLGDSPEYVSLVMAGKHITAIGIILNKNDPTKINLEKLDERIRDGVNLLKITSAFIHAKQGDFSLHVGKDEIESKPGYGGDVIKKECETCVNDTYRIGNPICNSCYNCGHWEQKND